MALFLTVIVLAALILLLLYPARSSYAQRRAFWHRNFAHRGLHTPDKTIPENSPAAFQAAISGGYGIELDIQLSRDGQVVVFHDDTLNRVCGVDGKVCDFTYEELQAMPICGTEQRIPLFSQVLSLIDGRAPLIVELKTGARNSELCQKAWNLLLPYTGSFCIESFDPFIVAWWRFHARQVLRGQLSSNFKDLRQYQPAWISFLVSHCLVNWISRPQFIAYNKHCTSLTAKLAVKLGAMPVVWTVHPEDDIQAIEARSRAVIFEFYTPKARF